VLPQGAHLNDAKNLRKRQMGPDDPKRAAILAKLGNDGAAVAMPRQVQKRQRLDLDPAPGKQDNAKKAVALGTPALRPRAMEVAHPRAGFDIAKVENAGMRRLFFIGFLKDEDVRGLGQHLAAQHIRGAPGVDRPVLPAAPVNVPACRRQMCQSSFHSLRQAVSRKPGQRLSPRHGRGNPFAGQTADRAGLRWRRTAVDPVRCARVPAFANPLATAPWPH
jgi:hypothetical protein